MLDLFNKRGARQYSLASYAKGLFTSQTRRIFFKFAKIFYRQIHTPNTTKPKKGRMLIISEADGLGDAILFRRTLEAIKNDYDIYLITKKYHVPAYKKIVDADHLFVAGSFFHFFKIAKKLKEKNFDLLLLHAFNIRSFIVTMIFFKKIPFKIGIFADQAKKFLNKAFDAVDYQNVIDIYSDLTSYLGGSYKLRSFDEYKHLPIKKTNQVLVHIGSGSLCKNWRIKNFIELFQMFDSSGIIYKVIGSEQDLSLIKKFSDQMSIKPVKIGSFSELVEMILNSEVVICHNTSILHLSFALGVKTISFNSKSNYDWWNPYKNLPNNEHYAFKASNKECGYSQQVKSLLLEKNKCGCSLFDSITPSAVFKEVQKMISQFSLQ